MDPFIQFLLGQTPQGTAPGAAMPAPAPEENVIEVQDRPFNNSMREGLVRGGPFSMGKTGGNILGILGDALLVGGGRDPMYQPRLQRARESEAMIDFTEDPRRAIDQLSQVNSTRASELFENLQERQSLDAARQAQIRGAQDEYEGTTHERALAMIGAAKDQRTYDALRQRYNQYYQTRGVSPLIELPDNFDEASSIWTAGIAPKDRASLQETERYHDETIRQDRREEFGRNYRENLGQRMTTSRTTTAEEGRDRRLEVSEEGRDRRSKKTTQRPAIKWGKRPDGTRYVIR